MTMKKTKKMRETTTTRRKKRTTTTTTRMGRTGRTKKRVTGVVAATTDLDDAARASRVADQGRPRGEGVRGRVVRGHGPRAFGPRRHVVGRDEGRPPGRGPSYGGKQLGTQ